MKFHPKFSNACIRSLFSQRKFHPKNSSCPGKVRPFFGSNENASKKLLDAWESFLFGQWNFIQNFLDAWIRPLD
jgi:hypothetical protein